MSAPSLPRRRHSTDTIPAHRRLRVPMDLTRRRVWRVSSVLFWGSLAVMWGSAWAAIIIELI